MEVRLAEQIKTIIQKPQGSWIFVGPAGGDREQVAHNLAYALHGHTKPVESCKLCRQLQASSHPDVITVTPSDKGSIGIDEVKTLQHTLALSRHDAAMPYRIMIVESADALTVQAQNALLKLLEEPPVDAIIILLVTSEAKLLDTVRSRCRTVYFGGGQTASTPALAEELLAADDFMRIVLAGKIDASFDVAGFRDALSSLLRADLRQAADSALQARGAARLEALERFDRNINSNVQPKAALTAFLLEAK